MLAVVRGVVVGVFEVEQWMPATRENLPDVPYADGSETHRLSFIARGAEGHARIGLIDQAGIIVATIENQPGEPGSVYSWWGRIPGTVCKTDIDTGNESR